MKTEIGNIVYCNDNSYAKCLNDDTNHYLASINFGIESPALEVMSKPFELKGKRFFRGAQMFVIVKCPKGLIHLILDPNR